MQAVVVVSVVRSLVVNGERQDEENAGGQRRVEVLTALCNMCPSYALTVRALCVSLYSLTFDFLLLLPMMPVFRIPIGKVEIHLDWCQLFRFSKSFSYVYKC